MIMCIDMGVDPAVAMSDIGDAVRAGELPHKPTLKQIKNWLNENY